MEEVKQYTAVIKDGKLFGKEVNTKTNAKMGKRHISYESMLSTTEVHPIEYYKIAIPSDWSNNGFAWSGYDCPVFIGEKFEAELVNDKLREIRLDKNKPTYVAPLEEDIPTQELEPAVKEFIICSAVWFKDGQSHKDQPVNIETGFVVCGRRHGNCYQTIMAVVGVERGTNIINNTLGNDRKNQGFLTSTDRFVDRIEGYRIARENNQIQFGREASDNGDESSLISENLY